MLRVENTVAIPDATMRINYTLKFDTTKYDIREFERELRITTLNNIK